MVHQVPFTLTQTPNGRTTEVSFEDVTIEQSGQYTVTLIAYFQDVWVDHTFTIDVRLCSPRNVLYTQEPDPDIYPGGPVIGGMITMDQLHSTCGGLYYVSITNYNELDIEITDSEIPFVASDDDVQVYFY